ncbi:MAG TPA: hypothetical protein DD415_07075 [Clostridiales bacterium]|nr:hypothetical protein [Clostridiales bacterium]
MIKSLLLSGADVMTIINSAFFILGGIVVFMLGMNMLGSNIEKAAGKQMRRLMGKATVNRFVGVGTGAAITVLCNSSSATTVMIVGFVNVGLMTLTQAASVIMGANIGTTISAFIMALSTVGGAQLSIAAVFALVAFVGFVFTLAGKKEKLKQVGAILEGVGIIFIGLNVMSAAVSDMLDNANVKEAVEGLFIALGNNEKQLSWEIPVLFLLGAVLTGLMQSSGALTAIVISLASANLINLEMAMCVILGTNVGTCVTSLISSIGTSVNAKRTAAVHLLFNVAGCLIFIWPVAFAGKYIAQALSGIDTQWQIAIFHMVFNLLTTAILLPFIHMLVKLACLIVPEKKGSEVADDGETLDLRLLKTPAIAVGQVRKQLLKMAEEAFSNYKLSLDMLFTGDLSRKNKFAETEENINATNKHIVSFLIKLSLQEVSETDEKKISSFYRVTSDLERIGDYAENIMEYAEKMSEYNVSFSEEAQSEIREMDLHLTNLYKNVYEVFATNDLKHIPDVEVEEQATDDMNKLMQKAHLSRMTDGVCTPEAGALFLQLAVNMERIGDHMHNIANSVIPYGHGGVAAHIKN